MEPQKTNKKNHHKIYIPIIVLLILIIPLALILGFSKGKQKLEIVGGTKEKIVKVEVPAKEDKNIVENVKEIITDEQTVKPYSIFVKEDGLSLYNQDSEKGKILAQLKYNEELQVVGISKKSGWYHIKRLIDDKAGWVSSEFGLTALYKIYKYNDSSKDLSKVKLKAIYFVPSDKQAESGWKEKLNDTLAELKIFISREFNNQIYLDYEIYPEIVQGLKGCRYYQNYPGVECGNLDDQSRKPRILDELNETLFTNGGKYFNKEFVSDKEKEYEVYGIFGHTPGQVSLGGNIGDNKFQIIGNGIETGKTIGNFLLTLGLPSENLEGNTQPGVGIKICSQLKNGVKQNYGDIMTSFTSYDREKSYIDDDLKKGMGFDWGKRNNGTTKHIHGTY